MGGPPMRRTGSAAMPVQSPQYLMLRIAVGIIDATAAIEMATSEATGRRKSRSRVGKMAIPHAGKRRRLNALLAVIRPEPRQDNQTYSTRLVWWARRANSKAAIGQSAVNMSLAMPPACKINPYPVG